MRLYLTRSEVRAQFHPFATCPVCGDDIHIHEWIDVSRNSDNLLNVVIDCDRN